MHEKSTSDKLASLFQLAFGVMPELQEQLPRSGSDRCYFRLSGGGYSAIGAFNPDIKENEAFFSFTRSFGKLGIRVPVLYAVAPDNKHYLVSDLGNETLYDRILKSGKGENCGSSICVLKEVLNGLLRIQIEGAKAIDFSKCYPREAFDRQSVMWDLNYFKYSFLKLAGVGFDEQLLEDDFNRLADYLLKTPSDYFMHRDFQARNIMLLNNHPWFIDYQGGRRGPLQYDLASLLFSPKTNLNSVQREVMLEYYLNLLQSYMPVNRQEFIDSYYAFVLVRILQALGAYGFRGLIENKPNFRSSIPVAIANLKYLFDNAFIKIDLPEIYSITGRLFDSPWGQPISLPSDKLTIRVTSFSYKKGIPSDPSENGGGFVFDCRGLPNPGRLAEYRQFTGCDKPVIDYLEQYETVKAFQEKAREIVKISIDEYLARGFNHLMVSFGCTGGQHRSVYNAEKFARWVENNFPVNVVLIHTEKKETFKHDKEKV